MFHHSQHLRKTRKRNISVDRCTTLPLFQEFTAVRFRSFFEEVQKVVINEPFLRQAAQYFSIIDEISWPFVKSYYTAMKELHKVLIYIDKAEYLCSGEWFNAASHLMLTVSSKSPQGPDYIYCDQIKYAIFVSLMEQISDRHFDKNCQEIKNSVPNRLLERECAAVYLFPPTRYFFMLKART